MTTRDVLDFPIAGFTLEKLLWALLVAVIGYILVHYFMKLVGRAIGRTPLQKTLHDFLVSCIRLALYFVVILLACDALGIPISSLLALFGVVGLAVSLSIQGSLSNLASGILLLLTKPFSAGDYIESGSVSGTVSSLNLIYTRMITPDNKVVFVPNSQLSAGQITNYTLMPTRRVDIPLTLPYSADIAQVKSLLIRAAGEVPQVLSEPAPFVLVSATGRNTIDYALRAWTATGDYWDAFSALHERVKAQLDQAGMQRPADVLDVRLAPNHTEPTDR